MSNRRIRLCPGFHAEPGPTPGHLHSVYASVPPMGENERVYVGELSKAAVKAWAKAEQERIHALRKLAAMEVKS